MGNASVTNCPSTLIVSNSSSSFFDVKTLMAELGDCFGGKPIFNVSILSVISVTTLWVSNSSIFLVLFFCPSMMTDPILSLTCISMVSINSALLITSSLTAPIPHLRDIPKMMDVCFQSGPDKIWLNGIDADISGTNTISFVIEK